MEYLVLLAVLAAVAMVIVILEARRAFLWRQRFTRSLYDDFGKLPQKEYAPERYARIGGYYNRHRSAGQIDDITWNDLDMDAVFRRMDYTLSAVGEEYLYSTLRTVCQGRVAPEHFEEMTAWFSEHADERVQVQLLMSRLGHTGKFSLYDYIDNLDYLGERSNARHILLNLLYLPLIALAPFQLSISLLGIAGLSTWQIVSYFKDKNEIEPYITSFAYVVRLMETCRKLCRLALPLCGAEQKCMERHLGNLQGVKSGSYWVFSSRQTKTSGTPLDLIMDYVRMIFHVDLIVFNKMLSQLRRHLEDIDGLITQAGLLETVIAVGSFRASLENGWCVPELYAGTSEELLIRAEEIYHPLLENPVKNSIRTRRGVLLTGSNASGKSTFLKTVALNAILSQTIHTCTADRYCAPHFRIFSSMSLRDDLGGGESYYIAEIKALKRILDAAREESSEPVLCFVDEVLRGTNTVERIAASTQIMKSLDGSRIICFAATHDIELTELLQSAYDNYHFEETVQNGDISFNYTLMEGKATTRNAIKLLEIMGYEPSIIERAGEMAQRFAETGVWQA